MPEEDKLKNREVIFKVDLLDEMYCSPRVAQHIVKLSLLRQTHYIAITLKILYLALVLDLVLMYTQITVSVSTFNLQCTWVAAILNN